MQSEIRHNCGLCVTHTLNDAYSFIESLQHRGREATGIVAIGDGVIDAVKWRGTVDSFDLEDLYKIFPASGYHTYGAHVRYATRGRKDKILEDAHPHIIGGKIIDKGDHIIIRGCDIAGIHNGQVSDRYFAEVDRSLLRTSCDTEALLHVYKQKGEIEMLRQIPGAYTIVIADKRKRGVTVMRDRTGIKPGVLGLKDGKAVVASEDIALRKNHAEFIEDLEPGTLYYLSPEGDFSKEAVVKPSLRYCFFEWNYIAHKDSILNGISVRTIRQLLGEKLADEFAPQDVDVVTFMPRCPETAARRFAERTGKPFVYTMYKRRAERAFQGSTAEDRQNSIKENLNGLDNADLKGKTVLDADDSTIRGNNSARGSELLKEAGAKKIYHASYSPKIGIVGEDGVPRGCEFGVDMSSKEDENHKFIARGRTDEEIAEKVGVDKVYFMSTDGMLEAFEKVGIPRDNLCTYCIGGPHPFLQIEDI